MTLAQLITDYRTSHGLSQRQMGAKCGLSTGYISLIEREINPQTGKAMVPTLTVLNKIAKGMHMTIDELIASCDDMPVNISEKPATENDDGLNEIIEIFSKLSADNRSKLLELSRLYLGAQSSPEGTE